MRSELAGQGWRVLDEEDGRPIHDGNGNRRLSGLTVSAEDSTPLDVDNHAGCAGRAVFVEMGWGGDVRTVEVCTDVAAGGHGERYSSSGFSSAPTRREDMSEEEAEVAREERRMTIANNKAMVAANETRREWVKGWLSTRRLPKAVLRFCVETFACRSWWGGGLVREHGGDGGGG